MAEHGNNHTANGAIELEVMRKADFSWHPCQVSLSPSGNGLVIKYGDDCLEDLIEDKEVALTRLRIRSSPLQGSDCSLVKEGDHVLATKKSQLKSLFFDAEVEKAQRVRHSARIYCRCTFRVKWLHKDLGDEVLVLPSCAIMKLATESINVHPTVCAFFKSFNSSNYFTKLPLPTIYGSMERRMETHEFPEAQTGKIRSSDVGVVIKGQTQSIEFATHKLHKDNKAEDSPGVFMLVKDESVEKRSPLNPLAARAALASLVSITHRFCMSDDLTTFNGISSKSEAASATLVPRRKNLFPSSSEEKHQVSDATFEADMKKNRDKTHEIADLSSTFTCSPTERKVRLTRSHKSLAVTSHEEVKVEPSTKRRLTRLALKSNQEVESAEADTATQGNLSAKQIECDFVQEGKKTVGSSMNQGISSTRRLTRSAARVETKKNDLNSSISLEQSKLFDHSQSDASKGESNMMGIQKSNSDSIVTEAHSPVAEESKINQTHATSKKTEADECNTKQNNVLKRKLIGSTTQQLRSSPRLNSTPQTRSQMKL